MQSSSVGEPHLSLLEQISPQAYVRFVLCFGLHSGSTHDEVIQALRSRPGSNSGPGSNLEQCCRFGGQSTLREGRPRISATKDEAMSSVKDLMSGGLDVEKIRSQGFQYDR